MLTITRRSLSALLFVLLATACFVTGISGPTTVNPGQTVTYDIPFETDSSGANGTAYVWLDVPSAWTFNSATYDATVNGANASGTPTTGVSQSGTPCVALSGPSAGYQRLGFSATFATVTANDSGVLHVSLTVNGASGPYQLAATGGGSFGGPSAQCNGTETLDVVVANGIPPTAPIVEKFFTPSSIAPGGTSRLTIRLQNDNVAPNTDVSFTDTYPAGLLNATTPNVANTCGGTPSSTANTVSLTGGTIPSNGVCTVSIDVTAAAEGTYVNDIPLGAVSSSVALPNEATTGTLNVSAAAASATVPTMSEWALLWMVALLALVALKMMR